MPELDDVQIDRPHRGPEDREPSRGQRSTLLWLVIAVVIALVAVGGYLFYRARQGGEGPADEAPPPPETAAPAEEDVERTPPDEELDLPPLDASDEIVRRVVGELSEHPTLASWLATDHLVRRFVLAVDNLAVGLAPRKHLPSMEPEGDFTVVEAEGGTIRPDPAAYDRYDSMAAIVGSIDAAGAVATYRKLRPVIDEMAAELGYPPGTFDQRLAQAIRHLLRTPVPDTPPELERRAMSYHYADPRYENLSEAQKQLLRMGPENQRVVMGTLEAVLSELGIKN